MGDIGNIKKKIAEDRHLKVVSKTLICYLHQLILVEKINEKTIYPELTLVDWKSFKVYLNLIFRYTHPQTQLFSYKRAYGTIKNL